MEEDKKRNLKNGIWGQVAKEEEEEKEEFNN